MTLFIIMTRVLSRIQAPPLFPSRPTASPYWVCSLLFTSTALEYGRLVVVNFVVPFGRCKGEGRFGPWEERCHLRDTLYVRNVPISLIFLAQPSTGQGRPVSVQSHDTDTTTTWQSGFPLFLEALN